ncbi:MAG: hypothetical protein ACOZCO_12760 [Bacteroidota bacterium]
MIKVKYKRSWGIVFMSSSIVLLLLYLLLYRLSGKIEPVQLTACLMIGIIGILYYFRVYFAYDEKQIVLFSPFGFVTRRYLFDKNTQLLLSGKKLYQVKGEKKKRVWISKSMITESDWKKLLGFYFGEDISGELHDI